MGKFRIPPSVPKVLKDARNKPEFSFDCLTQIKGIDPTAPQFIEFDWQLLSRNLGEPQEEMTGPDFALITQVIHELLRWILRDCKLEMIGRRAVALQRAFQRN